MDVRFIAWAGYELAPHDEGIGSVTVVQDLGTPDVLGKTLDNRTVTAKDLVPKVEADFKDLKPTTTKVDYTNLKPFPKPKKT